MALKADQLNAASKACGQLAQSDDCSGDVPGCPIAYVGFVVSGVDASEFLDLAEVIFDEVAPFVHFLVMRDVCSAVALGRNDGFCAALGQVLAEMVCVESFVAEEGVKGQPFNQSRRADNFTALAG